MYAVQRRHSGSVRVRAGQLRGAAIGGAARHQVPPRRASGGLQPAPLHTKRPTRHKSQTMPGLGSVYINLLRAALRKGKAPKSLAGHRAVTVSVATPVKPSPARYAAYVKLLGFEASPQDSPLM